MKRISIITIILMLFSIVIISPTKAWNATGHEIVAVIAYRQVSDTTKDAIFTLLQQHPGFDNWQEEWEALEEGTIELDQYTFLRASIWPDEIRRSGNQFDHLNWHFVDYQYLPPNASNKPRQPLPKDNILLGLKSSELIIKDDDSEDEEKAASISWIIHLVGDIHQPLHCVSMFSNTFPEPDGDQGGNKFFIRPGSFGMKLHSFWDGLLGSTKQATNIKGIVNEAKKLENTFPKSNFNQIMSHDKTTTSWSIASYQLAVDKAYLKGELPVGTKAGNAKTTPQNYTKDAKALAESQIALAGYRLAEMMKRLFPNS